MLSEVKTALGITGSYQDETIQAYINEVQEEAITPGLVARGVADLWNYGSGEGKLSTYFMQRAAQLSYKGDDENE